MYFARAFHFRVFLKYLIVNYPNHQIFQFLFVISTLSFRYSIYPFDCAYNDTQSK